jgi:hypothetical protein
MGKAALFAIIAFGVMGAYYGLNTQRGMFDTSERIAGHQHEILARNAAMAGYNHARQMLTESFANYASGPKTFEDGAFEVSVNASLTEATITAKGYSQLTSGLSSLSSLDDKLVTYIIEAKVKKENLFTIAEEPPAFMQYGLITEGDLTLDGNVSVDTLRIAGSEGLVYNANVHTNSKLTVQGNAALVRGFGTYVTASNVRQLDVFKPYHNPTNDPVVKKTTAIDIPAASFDPVALATKMLPQEMTAGDVSLSGGYDFKAKGATRENPYIWHVDGNLNIAGNTTLSGYVMFIVSGSINVNGNVEMGSHEGPGESNFAFYAGDDVVFGGNAETVNGQIFAKDDIVFNGTPKIVGNLCAGDKTDLKGTPNIYYVPASPALTTVWQVPETRLTLLSYNEKEPQKNATMQ